MTAFGLADDDHVRDPVRTYLCFCCLHAYNLRYGALRRATVCNSCNLCHVCDGVQGVGTPAEIPAPRTADRIGRPWR